MSEAMDEGTVSPDGNVIKGNPLEHIVHCTFSGSAASFDFVSAFLHRDDARTKAREQGYGAAPPAAAYVTREHYQPPLPEVYADLHLLSLLDDKPKTRSVLSEALKQAERLDQSRRISLRPRADLEIVDKILDTLYPPYRLFLVLDAFMQRTSKCTYEAALVVKHGISKLDTHIKQYSDLRATIAKQVFPSLRHNP